MPGYILIGCVVLLVILLIKQRNDKGTVIYTVYADNDDDDVEKEKENEKTDSIN